MHNNKYTPINLNNAKKYLFERYKDEATANRVLASIGFPLEEVVEQTANATTENPATLNGVVVIRPMSPPLDNPEGELEVADFPSYTTPFFLDAYDPETNTTVFTEPVDNFMPHLYSLGTFLRYYNRTHRNTRIATKDLGTSKYPLPSNLLDVIIEKGYGVVPNDQRMKRAIRLPASGAKAAEEVLVTITNPTEQRFYAPSATYAALGSKSLGALNSRLKALGAEGLLAPAYIDKRNGKGIYTDEQVRVAERFLTKRATIEEYNAAYGEQTPCIVYTNKASLTEALLLATGIYELKGFTSGGAGSRVYVETNKEN